MSCCVGIIFSHGKLLTYQASFSRNGDNPPECGYLHGRVLENVRTRDPLTLCSVHVLVQVQVWVHIPGDPQSVQLRNDTATTTTKSLICLILICHQIQTEQVWECLLGGVYVPRIYRMPGGVIVGDSGLCCLHIQCMTSIARAQLLPIVCWFYRF